MKEIRYTKQFKKDVKRFINQPKKLQGASQCYRLSKTRRRASS